MSGKLEFVHGTRGFSFMRLLFIREQRSGLGLEWSLSPRPWLVWLGMKYTEQSALKDKYKWFIKASTNLHVAVHITQIIKK